METNKSETKSKKFAIICKNCGNNNTIFKIKETETNAVVDLLCLDCKSDERIY